MTTQTQPATAYAISTSAFTDYACEECATDFATENGLTWNGAWRSFTIQEGDVHAYQVRDGECDYPATCGGCGVYLAVDLTSYGRQELEEGSGFPAWLLAYHLGE